MKKTISILGLLITIISIASGQLTVVKTLAEIKIDTKLINCKYLARNDSTEIMIQFYSNSEGATEFGIVKLKNQAQADQFSTDVGSIIEVWDQASKDTKIEIIREKYSLHLVYVMGTSMLLLDRSFLNEEGKSDRWQSIKLKDAKKLMAFVDEYKSGLTNE